MQQTVSSGTNCGPDFFKHLTDKWLWSQDQPHWRQWDHHCNHRRYGTNPPDTRCSHEHPIVSMWISVHRISIYIFWVKSWAPSSQWQNFHCLQKGCSDDYVKTHMHTHHPYYWLCRGVGEGWPCILQTRLSKEISLSFTNLAISIQ